MNKYHMEYRIQVLFIFTESGWRFFRIIYKHLGSHSLNTSFHIFYFENALQKLIKLLKIVFEKFMVNIEHLW